MKPPFGKDFFMGTFSRDWDRSQLGVVTAVSDDTNVVTVEYTTCIGKESNCYFINPLQFGKNYGIIMKPYEGMVVEVVTLHDNTIFCRPFPGYFRNTVQSEDFESQIENAGNEVTRLNDGEIRFGTEFGSEIFFLDDGSLMLSDSTTNSVTLNTFAGIDLESNFVVSRTLENTKETIGIPQRLYYVDGLPQTINVAPTVGKSNPQSYEIELQPSQVSPTTKLMSYRYQVGDIYKDLPPYTEDPLSLKKETFSNVTGVQTISHEQDRNGSIKTVLGPTKLIKEEKDALTGKVSLDYVEMLVKTVSQTIEASAKGFKLTHREMEVKVDDKEITLKTPTSQIQMTAAGTLKVDGLILNLNVQAMTIGTPKDFLTINALTTFSLSPSFVIGSPTNLPLIGATARMLLPVVVAGQAGVIPVL